MRHLIPFDGLFGDSALDRFFDEGPMTYRPYIAVPKVDIEELDDRYEITTDMPGFKKEEIRISYDNDILSISAKKNTEKETKNDNRHFITRERTAYGFERQFSVKGIKKAGIKANLTDGVLKISLPKMDKEEIKEETRIQID